MQSLLSPLIFITGTKLAIQFENLKGIMIFAQQPFNLLFN